MTQPHSTRRDEDLAATPSSPRPRRHIPRVPALLVAAAAVTALATGCSAAENAAQDVKDAAKSQATQAVANEVENQICSVVGDGVVSDTDLAILRSVLGRASDAGLPPEVTGPLGDITQDGRKATDAVDDLQKRCAARQ